MCDKERKSGHTNASRASRPKNLSRASKSKKGSRRNRTQVLSSSSDSENDGVARQGKSSMKPQSILGRLHLLTSCHNLKPVLITMAGQLRKQPSNYLITVTMMRRVA